MQSTTAKVQQIIAVGSAARLKQMLTDGLIQDELKKDIQVLIKENETLKSNLNGVKNVLNEITRERDNYRKVLKDAATSAEVRKQAHERIERYKIYGILFGAMLVLAAVCTTICSLIIR